MTEQSRGNDEVIAMLLIKHYTVNMYGAVEFWFHVLNLGHCMEVSGHIHARPLYTYGICS